MSLIGMGIKRVFSQKNFNIGDEMIVEDQEGTRYAIPIVGESSNDLIPEGGSKRMGKGYYDVDTDRARVLDQNGHKNGTLPHYGN